MRFFAKLGCLLGLLSSIAVAGPYSGAPADDGDPPNSSDAVAAGDLRIQGWASGYLDFAPGPRQVGNASASMAASFGTPGNALDAANSSLDDPTPVVSLGDGGRITLTFSKPIADGPGADFAVFENAFNNTFLELAFVEVSSDGNHFLRLPAW